MGWVLVSERELNRLSEFIDGRHRPARLDESLPLTSVASPVHRML